MSESHNNGIQILSDIIKDFDLEKPVPEYFYLGFVRFFREKNRSFAPRREELIQYDTDNHLRNGVKLGEIDFSGREQMVVCTFETTQSLTERSGKKAQYREGKKILKDSQKDAGIFIFYDQKGNFRFSLIYVNYSGTRRDWSSFRRFTYFVSREFTNKTFLERIGDGDFSSPDKIKEAFSVEPVTRQFYSELQNWYFWAMDKVQFPKDFEYSVDSKKDEELRNSINLIRLITRIIFIWFLTEKGVVPRSLFSRERLRGIVKDFKSGSGSSNYYNAILQNLFFGTLNQKMDERKFANENGYPAHKKEFGVKTLYRYSDKFLIAKEEAIKLFKDIPFLNGGLFDCLDKEDETGRLTYIDDFSRNPKKQAIIPDYLLFEEKEERVDLSDYGLGVNKSVKGLFEILNNYNFTIDENTPIDQEVALDPELLGKVFENLLASYNPETATTARKATGSYYTTREIVDYMVEESLIAYLTTTLERHSSALSCHSRPMSKYGVNSSGNPEGSDGVIASEAKQSKSQSEITLDSMNSRDDNESSLRHLLSYKDEPHIFSEAEARKIIAAINNIKVLDPACGSGAFPMGMLHKLVHILHKLDTDNKVWYEIQYQKAIAETETAFRIGKKEDREQRLKEINEVFDQNINEPDYARKLYLIENCIYGVDIQPIAVQISKLRFFISLVIDQKTDRQKPNCGILSLPNLETKFVAANTLIGLDRPRQLAFKNPDIAKKEDELKQIRHKYFEAKTRKEKLDYQKKDAQIRMEIADLLKHSGWDTSIAEKIAAFDLYDQNTSADWFDPEWMFGIVAGTSSSSKQNGFDIVIGNPPYKILTKNNTLSFELVYLLQNYRSIKRSYSKNLFTLFIERGINILSTQGVLSFIVPEGLFKTRSYAGCVETIQNSGHVKSIATFTEYVFENAITGNLIFVFLKGEKGITENYHFDKNLEIGKAYQKEDRIIQKIQAISFTKSLRDVATLFKGMVVKDRDLFLSDNSKGKKNVFLLGKNISKWKLDSRFFTTYEDLEIIGGTKQKAKHDYYPRILIRRTGNTLCCTLLEEPALTESTLYSCWSNTENISNKYLLALFNSRLLDYYVKTMMVTNKQAFPQILMTDLEDLPIIVVDEKKQQPFITVVDQILAAKKKNSDADTSVLGKEIDRMVYKLYDLTPEEIAIVEWKT